MKVKGLNICSIFLILLFARFLQAENLDVTLPDKATVFIDSGNHISFQEVRKQTFSPASNDDFNAGFTNYIYWYHFFLLNTQKGEILQIDNPELDFIEAYFVDDKDSIIQYQQAGAFNDFSSRILKNRTPSFKILDGTSQVYLKVLSETTLNVPIRIKSPDQYSRDNIFGIIAFSFLHAIILIFFIYNLILFIALKRAIYGYYSLYLASMFMTGLSITGLGYQLFWPSHPSFNSFTSIFFVSSMMVSFCLFTTRILNLKIFMPILYRLFIILAAIGPLIIVAILFLSRSLLIQLLHIFPLIGMLMAVMGAIIGIGRGYKPAQFYLMGWSAFFLGATLFQLRDWGLITDNFLTANFSFVGAAIEAIFFSYGIALKMKTYQKEINDSKSKISEYETELELLRKELIKPDRKKTGGQTINQQRINQYLINPLSDREVEVLTLIAEGKTNKEVANLLFVSVNTIKTHVKKIYDKLDVKNRTEAVTKANSLELLA